MAAGYSVYSPVKVALDERDAITSSEGEFQFDIDGFKTDKFPVFETTGGLNMNEAWLAYDRHGNGFFNEKRVLDGDDIFGDHLGQYISGYEDLAETFKNEIEADEQHRRYIPLHELNWFDSFWIWLTRLFGLNTDPIASYDLQLIKSTNDVVPANTVFTRIYVDYVNTEEFDKTGNNAILQRAPVVYKSGKTTQSGDLWFRPKLNLFATPVSQEAKE